MAKDHVAGWSSSLCMREMQPKATVTSCSGAFLVLQSLGEEGGEPEANLGYSLAF